MPFKSTAQQRYMYSQHPDIARRWTDEMRGGKKASKSQREHPIKHANLPDRVGKGLLGGLRRAKMAGPVIRSGVTRAGTVGMEFEHQGVKGWGVNETAARASWQQNRAARNGVSVGKRLIGDGEVVKGITRQGVAPVLARVKPMASTNAAPKTLIAKPVNNVIGKAGFGEALHTMRLVPKAAKGGWKVGTGGKLKAGLADTQKLNSSKTLQHVGGATKWAAQNRGAAGLSAGVVGGSVLGAGLAHRDDVDKAAQMCPRCKNVIERGAKRCMNCGKRIEPVAKAYGDPEDSRYYRLGAGSAVLGAGGLGGLEYARRDVSRSSRLARQGSPMGVHNLKNVTLVSFDNDKLKEAEGNPKMRAQGKILNPKLVHGADRLARHGLAVTRRGALVGAGGLAALGGAAALHQRAHERRYN